MERFAEPARSNAHDWRISMRIPLSTTSSCFSITPSWKIVTTLRRITDRVKPQQFHHLAGQSHVGLSFEMPETTCELTAIGTLRILEVLRDTASPPKFLHRQLK